MPSGDRTLCVVIEGSRGRETEQNRAGTVYIGDVYVKGVRFLSSTLLNIFTIMTDIQCLESSGMFECRQIRSQFTVIISKTTLI